MTILDKCAGLVLCAIVLFSVLGIIHRPCEVFFISNTVWSSVHTLSECRSQGFKAKQFAGQC